MLLKAAGWYPEMYREPPSRRTRVLGIDFMQGRFGNPATIPPLPGATGGKSPRALPIIEPGSSILTMYNQSPESTLRNVLPSELLSLLREGRAAWRPAKPLYGPICFL